MLRVRVAVVCAALLALAVPFVAAVADRDSVLALMFLLPAAAVAPLLFLVTRADAFRIVAATVAAALLPYAVLTALSGDPYLFPRERWGIWIALVLVILAAALPRRP